MPKISYMVINDIRRICLPLVASATLAYFVALPVFAQQNATVSPAQESPVSINTQSSSPVIIGTTTIMIQGQTINEEVKGRVNGVVAKHGYTAMKTDTPLIKTPQSVSVVTRDQIELQGADSVAQALNYSSGVGPIFGGTTNRYNEVHIRGLSAADFYLDGLSVDGPKKLNSWLLERVEVIKGPSSVLYGQASPGGLVNMVSKRPSTDPIRTIRFGGGTRNHAEFAFDFGGALPNNPNILYRLNGIYSQTNDFIEHHKDQLFAIAPALAITLGDKTTLTLLTSYQKEPKMGSRVYYPVDGTLYRTPFGRMSMKFDMGEPSYDQAQREHAMVGYEFEHRFSETLTFRQNVRYALTNDNSNYFLFTRLDQRSNNPTLMLRQPSRMKGRIQEFAIDNQLNAKFSTGAIAHNIVAGFDYKWRLNDSASWAGRVGYPLDWRRPIYGTEVDQRTFTQRSDQRRKITQKGVYLQDQLEINNWNIVLAGRYDWAESGTKNLLRNMITTQSDTAFTGRAAVLYAFDNGLSPYISYSTSFQPNTAVGAPDAAPFKPTEGSQVELGLKYQPAGYNMTFSAAVYELNQTNVTTFNPTTQYNEQIGKMRSRGVELEARAAITDHFDLVGAYTYTDVKRVRTLNEKELGKTLTIIPKHAASLWGNYRFNNGPLNGLSLGAGVRYVGSTFGDNVNSFKVPAYTNVDLMMRYDLEQAISKFAGSRFQINVKNLANKKFVASCRTASACLLGAGRSINAALVINF